MKAVSLYALTAFGGPHGHIGMMIKTFARKKHYVTEEELLEYNAFCQMLPGPSSTQTVMLIAMKRGGVPLALLALLIWIFPAVLLMAGFSFLLYFFDAKDIQTNLFLYIQPMSVGFIFYAAMRMMRSNIRHAATYAIMFGSIVATVLIPSPWVFPALLVVAGTISNFSNKRIPERNKNPRPIRWISLWLFFLIFIAAGILSEVARAHEWEHRRIFNLFENFYRFGSIVFGGGQALMPMMLYQFVSRPIHQGTAPWLTSTELLTGYGLIQALPGPVFSICAFVGGMAMSTFGPGWQVLGSITATIAVFLPSTLLLFFLFPLYQNLKQHVIIFRALEGINAAIVGIIWATGLVLLRMLMPEPSPGILMTNFTVIAITFCLLYFTRIPAPLIVLGWILLGWIGHGFQ